MKLKKGILFTIILILIFGIFSSFSHVEAAKGNKTLNIKLLRESGYGYRLNGLKNIWKIFEVGTSGRDTIYCLRGGPGFGSADMSSATPSSKTYTDYFDLKDPDSIDDDFLNSLLISPYDDPDEYEALMWILDNCYVPTASNASTMRQNLLDAAADYAEKTLNPDVTEYELSLLTDDDIDVVQQLAIWHYTNPEGSRYDEYFVDTFELYLVDENGVDDELSSDTYIDGWDRAYACQALFDYFVNTPKQSGFSYDYEGISSEPPVNLDTTSPVIENPENSNRTIIGPYRIRKVRDAQYSLNIEVLDGNNDEISSVQLLNSQKNAVSSGTTIKDLVGNDVFYISVPRTTDTSSITFKINGSYATSTTTLWSEENPSNQKQPVVLIKKENKNILGQLKITQEPEEKIFDLALRKFITKIDGVDVPVSREPEISQTQINALKQGATTAIKEHPKNALEVEQNDIVRYTIRVYNEGEVAGYATEVTDHLPAGLTFLPNSTINKQYGWIASSDGKTIKTNYLQNKIINEFNGQSLDFEDLEIECQVTAPVKSTTQDLKNIAEITAHKDEEGNTRVTDRDSTPNNVNINNYGTQSQQDDDDFEHLQLLGKKFDLALRKFITQINGVILTGEEDREPQISDEEIKALKNGKETAEKLHPKDVKTVKQNNVVKYTIRVYNEGEMAGYATEVTDYLPAGLTFLPNSEINKQYGWTASSDGKTITTTYLKDKLIDAFDGKKLDYEDLEIECQVTAKVTTSNQELKNVAEITAHKDVNGDTTIKDRDSIPDNVDKDNYQEQSQEDDDDFEHLVLLGEEFDLALRKFITEINKVPLPEKESREPTISDKEIEALKENKTTAEKVHPKDELIVKQNDIVKYTIRVYNEGGIAGYATEVTDYLPTGLTFLPNSEINKKYGWTVSEDGRTVKTTYLQDKLLKAFDGENIDYIDLEIECQVNVNESSVNQDLKNIAEITKHKDENGNSDVKDRDSTPDNVNKNNYTDKSQQDDDDFEHLVVLGKEFDLSLRKFIKSVQNEEKTVTYNRAPNVVVEPLLNRTSTSAIYNHDKSPVSVDFGDIVIYTIRVYNEGDRDGYVTEIKDHLPKQLEFIVNDELNAKYGWEISSDGRTVTTDITSPNTQNSANRDEIFKDRANGVLLKAFTDERETLDYIDVQIKCKVKQDINLFEKITNIADITGFTDKNGQIVTDRDSQKDNIAIPSDEQLPTYKDAAIERGDEYIPGDQDDDDFEKLILRRFDLALRKFITGVNEQEIKERAPVFTKVSDTEYKYVHPKDPVEVANGNIVIYTLRIFNEGNVSGYASEVKDDVPAGLEFLPDNSINTAFRWKMYREDGIETTEVSEAKYIRTDYLSKENQQVDGDNLIDAFNPETMTMPDYKDLKIAFKVIEQDTSDRIIINTAEITDDSDEDGKEIEDVDSTPDNDIDEEDDIDNEKIKVKYFDLSLKKWVTESIVTYDGKTTVTKTGHTGDENPEPPAKVEIRGSRISKTTVKFKFNIKVTNEGEIAGYVKELIDYVPEGLVFEAADNPKWRIKENKVLTDQLKDTLLQPGESATVEIILRWVNNKNNMGLKTNWAEIYEDDNEFDSPDIDSTPGNNVEGEDDIDDAPVILAVVTGKQATYIILAISSIAMLAGGIILIKKFVIV